MARHDASSKGDIAAEAVAEDRLDVLDLGLAVGEAIKDGCGEFRPVTVAVLAGERVLHIAQPGHSGGRRPCVG